MIIAGMATIKGREEATMDAIKSIASQVDLLFVVTESFWVNLPFDNVITICEQGGDERKFMGCWNKYFRVQHNYYFSLDDDLIYPPDYVESTIKRLNSLGGIVTYHGRTITGKIQSYYRDFLSPRSQCLHSLDSDIKINVPGTGCMAFKNKDFNLFKQDFPIDRYPLMSDIHVGIAAQRWQVPITALSHDAGWIRHTVKIDLEETIFCKHKHRDELQTELCNSIDWKVY